MRLNISRIQIDVGVRVFSGLISGLMIIFVGQNLSASEFAQFQILFNYGGIIYWLSDLGLLGLAFVSASKGDFVNFALNWQLRARMVILAILLLSILAISGSIKFSSYILILVGAQEVIVDAHLPIRQIMQSQLSNTMSVLIRKTMQVGLLSFFLINNQDLTVVSLAVIFGLPTFLILVRDFIFFSKFESTPKIRQLFISSKYFLQSLGTGVASFDYSLMGYFGFDYLIYPYALGQKFARFITIPGQTNLQSVIKAEQEIGNNQWKFLRKVLLPMTTTLVFSCLASVTFIVFQPKLLGNSPTPRDSLIVLALIFLPLGSTISSSLNAILIARSLFKIAAFSTFLSSILYLTFLSIGFGGEYHIHLILVAGIYLNSFLEILILYYFLFFRKSLKI